MKIDGKLRSALRQAVEAAGGVCEFARRCRVDAANISRYLNGKVGAISDDNWGKLAPYLTDADTGNRRDGVIRNTPELRDAVRRAMRDQQIADAAMLNRRIGYDLVHTLERLLTGELKYWFPEVLSAVLTQLGVDYNGLSLNAAEKGLLMPQELFRNGAMLVRPIPVVSWANAAGCLEMITSPESSLAAHWNPESTETVPVPVGGRSDILAFRVFGISMEPTILDNDVILVEPAVSAGVIPENRIVILRTSDGEVYCKRLHHQPGKLLLTSDNPAGRILSIPLADIDWLGMVVRKVSEL